MPRTLTAADRSALIRLASTMDKGSPERKAILAGLEKSASPLMAVQQIIGKLVNDRALKAHRPTQVITKNPPQGQITLRGIRDNLTITVAQNEDGLGYFAVGKKDGKAHVFVSSRRPIPLGGAIQKVTRPIIEAVKEWEAGQEPLFKAGSSKKEKYVQLFRDLADKRRKTIQVDLKGVMGGSTNGLREFKRGRMGRPKRWSGGRKGPFSRVSLSIIPLDDMGNPIKMRSGYKLWLSEYDDGTADVSASIGDMAIFIEDMKA